MQDSGQLLGYLQQGIDELLEQRGFDGGQKFRRTQAQALEAYQRYLSNDKYTTEEKLKGFFEIPTGVGKTAIFVGIVAAAQKAAQADGEELKTVIVVPTLTLLNQTLEAFQGNGKDPSDEKYFAGFAPDLKNKIGLYGGRNKNLKLPFTIMTYDAWALQLENGTLDPDDIDILITDEAHRGTSGKRVDLSAQFNGGSTLQIAFTATAEFDDEKSVYNSHERRIFYKPVAQSIRERELAAYVSSQRLGIRVDPTEYMLSDEFEEASFEGKVAHRRAAKQNAWNKHMLKMFREGTDQKTLDPLSDNQAGFFVEGIRQANKMEDMLNKDAVLNAKATSMGYKAVAVAIHSGLPIKEQEDRMRDYQDGKYLAVIGDEKFKEGFDHPPMKTIFDCPHESKVDKAQIIGRGLRKWWNKVKDRWEGLTVVESFMYFADEDLEKEQDNKENAMMRSISVKQIIGDVHIDSLDSPTYGTDGNPNGSGGGGGVLVFDEDDPDVEAHITIKELYALEEETDELREAKRLKEEALWKNNPLTMSDIKLSIEAHRQENDGKNPTVDLGELSLGPLARRIAWYSVDRSICSAAQGSIYGNGLANDLKYQKYLGSLDVYEKPGLVSALTYFGFAKKRAKLNMADIKATIEAYRKENEGKNPTSDAGDIICGPLAGRMNTWNALTVAIEKQRNGLLDDPEYQKYKKSLDKNQTKSLYSSLIYFGFAKKKVKLNMADIKATIEVYKKENEGKNPTSGWDSGDIKVGPLAGQTTWNNLSSLIGSGGNGLADDPEYQKYKKSLDKDQKRSLYSSLVYFGFAEKSKPLTMADIKATVEAYRKANGNKNPTSNLGDLENEPLAGRINTWQALNAAIKNRANNLPDDPEYTKYIESLDADQKAGLSSALSSFGFTEKQQPLTMADIKVTIKAYREANGGKNPSQESGEIIHGSLAGLIWSGLNAAIAKGSRELKNDPEYQEWLKVEPKPSLPKFRKKMDAEMQQQIVKSPPNLNGGP